MLKYKYYFVYYLYFNFIIKSAFEMIKGVNNSILKIVSNILLLQILQKSYIIFIYILYLFIYLHFIFIFQKTLLFLNKHNQHLLQPFRGALPKEIPLPLFYLNLETLPNIHDKQDVW